jgi:hypothetical protein
MGTIPELIAAAWAQAMPGREAAAVNELMRAIAQKKALSALPDPIRRTDGAHPVRPSTHRAFARESN